MGGAIGVIKRVEYSIVKRPFPSEPAASCRLRSKIGLNSRSVAVVVYIRE